MSSRPRALAAKTAAIVRIELEREVCVELYAECRPLGRIVLRDGGRTVAAGVISAILQ